MVKHVGGALYELLVLLQQQLNPAVGTRSMKWMVQTMWT